MEIIIVVETDYKLGTCTSVSIWTQPVSRDTTTYQIIYHCCTPWCIFIRVDQYRTVLLLAIITKYGFQLANELDCMKRCWVIDEQSSIANSILLDGCTASLPIIASNK